MGIAHILNKSKRNLFPNTEVKWKLAVFFSPFVEKDNPKLEIPCEMCYTYVVNAGFKEFLEGDRTLLFLLEAATRGVL